MIELESIIRVIADEFDVEYNLVRGSRRTKEISLVRQYCYFAIEKIWAGATIMSIARCFDRDHTTILYGIKKAKQNLEKRPSDFEKMQISLEAIKEYINEYKNHYETKKNSFSNLTTVYLDPVA